jgi:hypothetical protein
VVSGRVQEGGAVRIGTRREWQAGKRSPELIIVIILVERVIPDKIIQKGRNWPSTWAYVMSGNAAFRKGKMLDGLMSRGGENGINKRSILTVLSRFKTLI